MNNSVRKLIFGRPGSGKTTLVVREMIQALQKGHYVYSNIKIKWYGRLYKLNFFQVFFNGLYRFGKAITKDSRDPKLNKLYKKRTSLINQRKAVIYNGNGIPNIDLTNIYVSLYNNNQAIEKIEKINDNIKYGYYRDYYFHLTRYTYFEDLEDAVKTITKVSLKNQNTGKKYLLALDEGFVDLNFQKKIPSYITNFFNQSRKLNLDVIVASQRPVAVFPAYRALCDYMIHIKKWYFGRFIATKYFVDFNANALPDLSVDKEGNEVGDRYANFRGKEVYPYFDTMQSIGLKDLKEEIL